MSRSDAMITVTCDRCGEEMQVDLCATARGGYDERNVDRELEFHGWVIHDDQDICDECVRQALIDTTPKGDSDTEGASDGQV